MQEQLLSNFSLAILQLLCLVINSTKTLDGFINTQETERQKKKELEIATIEDWICVEDNEGQRQIIC